VNTRLLLALAFLCCAGISPADDLVRDFQSPPESAKPWVYWFWLNGDITREGITADLEAMKRVGIGGVLIMEVDQGAPVGPVDFMGAQWRDLFRHVISEADRLGLEVNMNNDAGWNGSGGPWIRPEESMQKVVCSEFDVQGPTRLDQVLKQPETVMGFYRDIAVLAFPAVGPYRIPGIQGKAAYTVGAAEAVRDTLSQEMLVARDRIIEISSHMDSTGRLAWDVPDGKWTIIRFGHTSTGVENAPAPATGRGLECDKLSKEGIEANFRGMMAKLIEDNKPFVGKALAATHVDSWENGSQNWTARMRDEFRSRRGYDMLPFLPVMTGRVVESLEVSERFLWDLRRTISEMVVEYYAGHLHRLANDGGLRFTIEAYGSPCDNIPYAGQCDEPMGEFWTPSGAIETCRTMASAAHVYGKSVVGAEAFTAGDHERWREHPASLKALGDQAFCEGINRFVFHRYAMQPWEPERKPGMTMGPWGQHYERTQTWWEQSSAWHKYLSRCQYLLRQGLFVADILYLQPEAPPHGVGNRDASGYGWDECSSEVVLSRLSVRNGRIVLPDGMSYRLMVLPNSPTMTPQLLARIRDLIRAGATVLGTRPHRSPSLTGYPACDDEVRRLADEIWADCDGVRVKECRFGRGRVVCGEMPEAVLERLGAQADFRSGLPLRYIHRRAGRADIYFVSNPRPQHVTTTATFRVTGKAPELWWPETGKIERAALYNEERGATSVSLSLAPSGSVFVVFRHRLPRNDGLAEVRRDGIGLLSAVPEPTRRVEVSRAVYGILDDPARTRDVSDRVRRKLSAGEYSFPAAAMAAGDDPAPGAVKTLVVDYVIDGRRHTVSARDSETVYVTDQAVKIRVEKAVYGILGDPERTRDVRSKVQGMVDSGISVFLVARMAEGDDPAYMVVKTLALEYTMGGRRHSIAATDPEVINLALPTSKPAPGCELTQGRRHTVLTAWEPGAYALVRKDGKKQEVVVPKYPAIVVDGPWHVSFPGGWGASESVTLDRLMSWTDHADDGVRFFSGAATYRTVFEVPAEMLADNRPLKLDLGEVLVIAEVKLNGSHLGVLWRPPFEVDVRRLLRPGANDLEVRVTNLWPNRMIGDEQLPEDSDRNPNGTLRSWPQWLLEGKPSPTGRLTFTSWRLWKKEDAPLRSGLIGPVRIVAGREVIVR